LGLLNLFRGTGDPLDASDLPLLLVAGAAALGCVAAFWAAKVRRYGASVVVMCFDEQGQADTVQRKVDIAELHAQFSHEELILTAALGLDAAKTAINPSGGALAANPIMSAGLVRIGEVARRITNGDADRGVAHATSGPCLQQNMVCVLEGE